MLLALRDDACAPAHPGPGDVLLLVEVADSSLDFDRKVKVPLYAAAGVAEVWIVNLAAEVVEVHRHASPSGYAESCTAGIGSSIAPSALPDLEIEVEGDRQADGPGRGRGRSGGPNPSARPLTALSCGIVEL